jgi:hypothetical protein
MKGEHFMEEKVSNVLLQLSVGKSIAKFAFAIPKDWSGKFKPQCVLELDLDFYLHCIRVLASCKKNL